MAAAFCLCGGSTLGAGAQARADRQAAETAIVKVDDVFCQATIDRNLDRFLSFVADDATFSGGGEVFRGKDAVAQGWAPFFKAGGWHVESRLRHRLRRAGQVRRNAIFTSRA
jgi:ketosteroid isomerase-like protein